MCLYINNKESLLCEMYKRNLYKSYFYIRNKHCTFKINIRIKYVVE